MKLERKNAINEEQDLESLIIDDVSDQIDKNQDDLYDINELMKSINETKSRTINNAEIVNLEITNEDKQILGMKKELKINYKLIFTIVFGIFIALFAINPFKNQLIENVKIEIANRYSNMHDAIYEKMRLLKIISNDDLKIVVENTDYDDFSFKRGESGECLLQINIADSSKSYFLIFEALDDSDLKNLFEDFDMISIKNEGKTSSMSVDYYNNNILYNYTSSYPTCFMIKMEQFGTTGICDIALSISYDDFIKYYQKSQNIRIFARKEY